MTLPRVRFLLQLLFLCFLHEHAFLLHPEDLSPDSSHSPHCAGKPQLRVLGPTPWSVKSSPSRLPLSVVSDSLRPAWTVAHHGFLSMGFSRQEYWSGLPCPPPGDLPDSGIKPRSLTLQADSLPSEPPGKPREDVIIMEVKKCSMLDSPSNHPPDNCPRSVEKLSFMKPAPGAKKVGGHFCGRWASQMALVVKNLPSNAGDVRDAGSIPGAGRSPGGGGHGNPVQYSRLENPHGQGSQEGCSP